MINTDQRRDTVLCFGLPETGKTTFLVALYHVVESREVKGSLVLDDGKMFESDREYIQKQRERWLSFKPVERNKADALGPILLTLSDPSSRQVVRLDLPDLSGESFRVQVDERAISNSLCARIANCRALLVFINPAVVKEPRTISEADLALGDQAADDSEASDAGEPEDAEKDSTEVEMSFSPENSCTAVKLVELLQFARPLLKSRPIPVAIIVSAFDVLAATPYRNDPGAYLREKLSLVDQYLRSNPESFAYKTFGVSAQGVGYEETDAVRKVAENDTAAERIRVVPSPPAGVNDISYPLKWLSQQERG